MLFLISCFKFWFVFFFLLPLLLKKGGGHELPLF